MTARKQSVYSQYCELLAEAGPVANDAAEEIRDLASEHVQSICRLADEYRELAGKELPEASQFRDRV